MHQGQKNHFASFLKRELLNMLKKNLLWFHMLSREEKCFHAQPSPAHSNSSSQPIQSFATKYRHLPSAFLCQIKLSTCHSAHFLNHPQEKTFQSSQKTRFLPQREMESFKNYFPHTHYGDFSKAFNQKPPDQQPSSKSDCC
jgi:hypothetical protein